MYSLQIVCLEYCLPLRFSNDSTVLRQLKEYIQDCCATHLFKGIRSLMKRYFSPPPAQISPFFLRLSCLLTVVEPIKISQFYLFNKVLRRQANENLRSRVLFGLLPTLFFGIDTVLLIEIC